jgi:hypothetical protein
MYCNDQALRMAGARPKGMRGISQAACGGHLRNNIEQEKVTECLPPLHIILYHCGTRRAQ